MPGPPDAVACASVEHRWLLAEFVAVFALNGAGTVFEVRSPVLACLHAVHGIGYVRAKLAINVNLKAVIKLWMR